MSNSLVLLASPKRKSTEREDGKKTLAITVDTETFETWKEVFGENENASGVLRNMLNYAIEKKLSENS